jgi:hypothetical protein
MGTTYKTLSKLQTAFRLFLVLGLFFSQIVVSEEEHSFSDAEKILWLTDQLDAVNEELELIYQFNKTSSFEPDFSDKITFTITGLNEDGTKAAKINFFSGERNVPVSPVLSTTLNPIFKIFLQGDVYEMNRLTDPRGEASERWRYFQKRIKLALASSAHVADVTFDFGGKGYSGKSVVFRPYLEDPNRRNFPELSKKKYLFLVSENLPGYLYKIETIVPGPKNKPALIKEILSLSEIRVLHIP